MKHDLKFYVGRKWTDIHTCTPLLVINISWACSLHETFSFIYNHSHIFFGFSSIWYIIHEVIVYIYLKWTSCRERCALATITDKSSICNWESCALLSCVFYWKKAIDVMEFSEVCLNYTTEPLISLKSIIIFPLDILCREVLYKIL